jgi:hypothetical protein
MDNMSWFDSYRGPKRIIVEPGQATCWIGFSVPEGNGRVMRKEFYTYGRHCGMRWPKRARCMNRFQIDYEPRKPL